MAVPSENELQLEARIIALEYLVKECLQSIIRMRVGKQAEDGDSDKDIEQLAVEDAKIFRLVARELRTASFPDLDPATSDHLSALVRDHALRVLKELVQEMEERLNNDSIARGLNVFADDAGERDRIAAAAQQLGLGQ